MRFQYRYEYNPGPKTHLRITILMSVAAAIIATVLYFKTIKHLEETTIFKAVVVESVRDTNGAYKTIIEFLSANGESIRFSPGFSSDIEFYPLGEEVEVFIHQDTGKPELVNFFTVYAAPAFAAIFSFISMLGAIGVYFSRVRNRT